MAICGSCGAETTKLRTIFGEGGSQDECPQCCPQSFAKATDPSDKKIWIGPEYAPNDYEKRYDADGVYYQPKPEVTAERERNLFVASEDQERYAAAVEKKRSERRTRKMSAAEEQAAIQMIDKLLRPLIEDPNTSYDA